MLLGSEWLTKGEFVVVIRVVGRIQDGMNIMNSDDGIINQPGLTEEKENPPRWPAMKMVNPVVVVDISLC